MSKKKRKQSNFKGQANGNGKGNGHLEVEITSNLPFFSVEKIVLAVSMFFVAMLRLRLLGMPLERDEGGFAYIAQRLSSSDQLYVDLIDNKLPGLYGLYAIFLKAFGNNEYGVHGGLLLCSLASMYLLYRLAKNWISPTAAAFSSLVLGIYAVSPNVFGFAAHATQLLLPFALAGFVFLIEGIEQQKSKKIFLSGLFLGIAFLIKQQAAVLGVFAGLFILTCAFLAKKNSKWLRDTVLFSVAAILPFALVAAYFALDGRMDDLWKWTVAIPSLMATKATEDTSSFTHFGDVVQGMWLYWIVAVAGIVSLFLTKKSAHSKVFALGFGLFSLISVLIGLGAYPHYFVLILPALALFAGFAFDFLFSFMGIKRKVFGIAIGLAISLFPVVLNGSYYFTPDFEKIHRKAYGMNPFPEMHKLAKGLQNRISKDASIGILGSEPELAFYLQSKMASRHLYMYPLLAAIDEGDIKSTTFQQEYLSDLKKNKPAFMVWVTQTGSWAPEYYKTDFFKSTKPFIEKNYVLCGKGESFEDGRPSVLLWDAAAQNYQFKGSFQTYIFKRKGL